MDLNLFPQSPAPLTAELLSASGRDKTVLLLSLAFASPVIYMPGPFSSLTCQIKSHLLQEALPDCSNWRWPPSLIT